MNSHIRCQKFLEGGNTSPWLSVERISHGATIRVQFVFNTTETVGIIANSTNVLFNLKTKVIWSLISVKNEDIALSEHRRNRRNCNSSSTASGLVVFIKFFLVLNNCIYLLLYFFFFWLFHRLLIFNWQFLLLNVYFDCCKRIFELKFCYKPD